MCKVIGILNEKGGVGKTTTATTLAYLLSQNNKRTALIDFDGQGHSSIVCGVNNINTLQTTISTLLSIIIPTQAEILSAQGLSELIKHFLSIKKNGNHRVCGKFCVGKIRHKTTRREIIG